MCGICGVAYNEPGRVDRQALGRANRLIAHRGPDDEGFYTDAHAGLAMRRLSIIDLTTGRQPISNPDGTIWIVFNGEVYNFLELRPELEKAGYPFKTKTDTEVVLALYEKMGTACVTRLRGMFAFAIWDKRRRRLFLARDRVGKKAPRLRAGAWIPVVRLGAALSFPMGGEPGAPPQGARPLSIPAVHPQPLHGLQARPEASPGPYPGV